MFEIGGLFGWLLIISYVGTLLNYVLKFINKKWGKKLFATEDRKKLFGILMKIFVKNHKYFGFATALFLILHFLIQFNQFGLNISGGIAAALLLLQVLLGVYATTAHKPRKGLWFLLHRAIAVLLILGIAIHLLLPKISELNNSASSSEPTATASTTTEKEFTLDELATYNGQNGQPAYVAYEGTVYDVSNQPNWNGGKHNGETAGTDLTNEISKSPHGDKVFQELPVVGTLK